VIQDRDTIFDLVMECPVKLLASSGNVPTTPERNQKRRDFLCLEIHEKIKNRPIPLIRIREVQFPVNPMLPIRTFHLWAKRRLIETLPQGPRENQDIPNLDEGI
jgi:hypothetical protein